MINVTVISGMLAVVAFLVTVIVQVSKDVIPLLSAVIPMH